MKTKLLLLLFLTLSSALSAQQDSTAKGNIYGDVFLNLNTNFNTSQSSFRLNRLHLGYKYRFNKNLYFNGMLESAREDYDPQTGYSGITNIFEMCVGFNFPMLEGKFGLIGTQLNPLQEKLWKHRYVDKVFADKYGFAPTNDFGVLVIYKPTKIFNLGLSVTNGEGHKEFQRDTAFRFAGNFILNLPAGIIIGAYGDVLAIPDLQQSNVIGVLGYQNKSVSVGVEWNQQFKTDNNADLSRGGISAYLSYDITDKYQLFGRYDNIATSIQNAAFGLPYSAADGSLIIAGLQYSVTPNIGTAIDYRAVLPENGADTQSYLFLDFYINF